MWWASFGPLILSLASPRASSVSFAAYYSAQKVVPHSETARWLSTLRTPLPLDVRASPRAPLAGHALKQLARLQHGTSAHELSWAGDRVVQYSTCAAAAKQLLHTQQLRGALIS